MVFEYQDLAQTEKACRHATRAERRTSDRILSAARVLRCRQPIVPDDRQAKRFVVSGMVHGVGYRFFAQRVADRIGVAGYVKNLRDGRVEVYAIGTAEQLRSLRAELERGPRAAEVGEVGEEDEPVRPKYAGGFGIEHDW